MNIALQNVSKNFGPALAADDITLEIAEGECFFLLGPSGCGKTTLLRMVAGFCTPDSGKILLDNQPANDLPPHRRNTGMVFQNYALWPHLTVFENVAFGLAVPGRKLPETERRRRVGNILEMVHMEAFAQRKPAELSGGQQQRVALARALVIDPKALLLDEPLSNLDAGLRLEMRVEIRRLVKRIGITTLYVTHDQKEALSMADRCAVLQNGKIVQTGAPRELYDQPTVRFVAEFMGHANMIPAKVTALNGHTLVLSSAFGSWTATKFHGHPQTGDNVTLAVRPEKIRFGAADNNLNTFNGQLKETIYMGESVETWISMPDNSVLKAISADEPCANAAGLFHVDPDQVMVLNAE